jgi:superfamily I DNA/RNA helicase
MEYCKIYYLEKLGTKWNSTCNNFSNKTGNRFFFQNDDFEIGFPGTRVFIEGDKVDSAEEILQKLSNWDKIDSVAIVNLKDWSKSGNAVVRQACARASRLLNLRGEEILSRKEFAEVIGRQRHHFKVYGRSQVEARKTVLTVHQAKNREFDFVIVLWSYMNQGGDLYSRKILYNALTRAKKDAVIIMQFNSSPKNKKKDATIRLIKENYDEQKLKKVVIKKTVARKVTIAKK